jgi:hypothetical protein
MGGEALAEPWTQVDSVRQHGGFGPQMAGGGKDHAIRRF